MSRARLHGRQQRVDRDLDGPDALHLGERSFDSLAHLTRNRRVRRFHRQHDLDGPVVLHFDASHGAGLNQVHPPTGRGNLMQLLENCLLGQGHETSCRGECQRPESVTDNS